MSLNAVMASGGIQEVSSQHAAWHAARNVLAIRLDNLGDVLMSTPAIRALKRSPGARRITLLASRSGAKAAPYVPEIDDVVVFDAPWLKQEQQVAPGARCDIINQLAAGRYDAAIIFTVYSQSPLPAAHLAWLADIPLRLGYCRENPYQLLTDWRPELEPAQIIRHEVTRQLELVASIGFAARDETLSFQYSSENRLRAAALLVQSGVDLRQPYVVIHPGATAPSRRYPGDKFGLSARQIALETGFQIVVTGLPAESALVTDVCSYAGSAALPLVRQMDLGVFGATIGGAALLVANNSGPVHIAAAVGTPVVDLYALTNPQHTPWQVPCRVLSHDVPCKYCYKSLCPLGHNDCLRRVTPDAVAEAARSLLERTRKHTFLATGIDCSASAGQWTAATLGA
jgi:lipopolysaccharide heptosyltransferase II